MITTNINLKSKRTMVKDKHTSLVRAKSRKIVTMEVKDI